MEDERRRIARELHDGVTQTLSGLVRGLELVRRDVDAPAATGIEHMRTAAQEALSDIRRVSRDLRPATLDDLGLLPAIESLVAELGERSGVEASLHSTGAVQTLTGAQQLCIFRIVQEALSNVERHARASTVEVTVDFQASEVLVNVRDDGEGIGKPSAVADFARQGRFGLLGMRERASLHGGTLTVTPVASGGTSVTLQLPTDGAARAEASTLTRE